LDWPALRLLRQRGVVADPARYEASMRIATVKWVDSASSTGWQSTPDSELFECETTGYIVHVDKRTVVMALNRSISSSPHPFGQTTTIPRAAVTSIKYVSSRTKKALAEGSKALRPALKRLAKR
jgi:hypothetical protein